VGHTDAIDTAAADKLLACFDSTPRYDGRMVRGAGDWAMFRFRRHRRAFTFNPAQDEAQSGPAAGTGPTSVLG
jgi:hypothetical protein